MPTIQTFAEAQDALRPLYENARTLYNLDNIQRLMTYLGNPQDTLRVVHIAGTSGKTSTSYYCAALLRAQGLTVGLTVSPHVDTINERMQINGQLLPEGEYCQLLGEFLDIVAESGVKPSYFETLTAFAYWYFAKQKVDYAVIEVGMGGQLDATNVVTRKDKLAVITDIGLDHTEILGDTLDKIAWFKAGIIKPGNQLYMYRQGEDVMRVVRQVATDQSAMLHEFDDTIAVRYPGLPLFQQRNLGLACQVVNAAAKRDGRTALSDNEQSQAAHTRIPARLERFTLADKTVIVDGSHNAQKLGTLAESISQLYPDQKPAVLCSFVQGSASRWQEGLQELIKVADRIIFTTFHSEKDYPKSSVGVDDFVKFCETIGFTDYEIVPAPDQAYRRLLSRPQSLLLITGSFYLLNHIWPLIQETGE